MDINLNNVQAQAIVISANETAVNDKVYHVVANATFTDPSPVEGKGFKVFVRNGTATIGGTSYGANSYVLRTFHSGAWANKLLSPGAYAFPNVDGTANQVLQTNGAGVVTWATVGAASGVCGIPNSLGVYTFYSTLSLAITAASSGQTIEVFANITETGAVQLNLKNGVNINFNGHTYTLNNAGTVNAISDNNAAVTCKLTNGIINRVGGTNTGSNSFCLDVINASSNIDATGMKFTSSFSQCCRLFEGTLTGGFYSGYTTGLSIGSGTANSVYCYGQTSDGISISGGELFNSKGLSNGRYGILLDGGVVSNCYAKSTVNAGALLQGGVVSNCTFFSSAGDGMWIYSGSPIIKNCLGYSTASRGISIDTTARVSDCVGYSTVNNGIAVNIDLPIYSCTAESAAASALFSRGKLYNCIAKSYWNNAAGHAITGNSTGFSEVFNCTLEVTNASANCLHYGSAINVKFGANVFKGATTSVNANITQTQANAPDTYGNIVIG
jgi:hypothetical protein